MAVRLQAVLQSVQNRLTARFRRLDWMVVMARIGNPRSVTRVPAHTAPRPRSLLVPLPAEVKPALRLVRQGLPSGDPLGWARPPAPAHQLAERASVVERTAPPTRLVDCVRDPVR